MPLVAKRKLSQTWRDAVALRGDEKALALVLQFDTLLRSGVAEGEAAYRVLQKAGKLWLVDEPGAAQPTCAAPDEVPPV